MKFLFQFNFSKVLEDCHRSTSNRYQKFTEILRAEVNQSNKIGVVVPSSGWEESIPNSIENIIPREYSIHKKEYDLVYIIGYKDNSILDFLEELKCK